MKLSNIFLAAIGATAVFAVSTATVEAADGEKVFRKCKACHTLEEGTHKIGPSLAGVFGRKAGTAKGYSKYRGLKGAKWTWDEATLMDYLEDPRKYTEAKTGTKSSMVLKLRKEKDRKAVIEYLKDK